MERETLQSSRLERFIDAETELSDILPLVHTTPAFCFADICKGDSIEPERCRFFDRNLLYLFFGRPAYRLEDSVDSELEFNWPIVFIFDPEKIGPIEAVFPFDTGAFHQRIYKEFFSGRSKIEDFKLRGALESARRIISRFYKNSSQYFSERSTKNVDIPSMEFEAQGVHALSRFPPIGKGPDERSSSIEVQLSHSIEIAKSAVAIILPQEYLKLEPVVKALARWNIPIVRFYEVFSFFDTEKRIGQLYPIVREIFSELGYLKADLGS
jgi:hypothetical protein